MSVLASNVNTSASLTAAWNGTGTEPANTTCTVAQPANGTVTFQISSIPSATITWEATVDGSTWEAVSALKLSTKAFAATATATGIYFVSCPGAMKVRGRCSSFTSGPVVIWGAGTVAPLMVAALSSGTGSASTVRITPDGTNFNDSVSFADVNGTAPVAVTSEDRFGVDIFVQDPIAGTPVSNRARAAVSLTATNGVGGGALVGAGIGAIGVAHGTNPSSVTAGNFGPIRTNRHGIPFFIGGHPNIISIRANYTSAQTNTKLVTVSSGTIIVLTGFMITCSNANTVNVASVIGFAQTNTPTTTQVVGAHPGIGPGSGYGRGNGTGIIGIGADGDDLILDLGVSTGGSTDVVATYFTIGS